MRRNSNKKKFLEGIKTSKPTNFFKYISTILITLLVLAACSGVNKEITSNVNSQTSTLTEANTEVTNSTKDNTSASTKVIITSLPSSQVSEGNEKLDKISVEENGNYSSKMEVAAYIYKFKKLPSNFLTKKEAMNKGWQASKGNLWKVTDKMSIGGDRFSNFEGTLPKKSGRQYFEVDINYKGGTRGPERIVYSNDGLIFYTKDHYKTFEKLN